MTDRQIRRAAERKTKKAARKAANLANAQRSTGPTTPEGKAISSQNNFRHGLSGTFRVLPAEDAAAFEKLLNDLCEEHTPGTATEDILVAGMAQHHWLVQRSLRLQDELFATQDLSDPNVQKQLALYIRYQTTNQRAFHKCLAELIKLRKATGCTQGGFVSQNRRKPISFGLIEPVDRDFGPGHPEFDAVTERVLAEYNEKLAAEQEKDSFETR